MALIRTEFRSKILPYKDCLPTHMKHFQLSKDVMPVAEFKAQLARVFESMRRSNRPVVITQNGRPAAVLVSPEEYDRLQERERFITAVRQGLEDADSGRLVSDEELERDLEAELGEDAGR